jgi:hypothetical protein
MFKPLRHLATPLLCVVFAAAMFGCESVSSTHMLGTPVAPPTDRVRDLSGTWMGDDGQTLTIKQLPGGSLRIAIITEEGAEDSFTFKLKQLRGQLTINGDRVFINVYPAADDPDHAGEPLRYSFLQLVGNAERNMVLHSPKVAVWRDAVENGKLPGEVVKGEHSLEVRLSASSEQLNGFVTEANIASLFNGDQPVVLRRTTATP